MSLLVPPGVEHIGVFVVSTDPTHDDFLDEARRSRLRSLAAFYDRARLRALVCPFNEGGSALSLRHLDHLLSFMAPTNGIVYPHGGRVVNLSDKYHEWQSVWKRRSFDCFRRHERVYWQDGGGDDKGRAGWHASTVGQLNWFFWADMHGVLDYARRRRDAIDASMRRQNRARRTASRTGERVPGPDRASSIRMFQEPQTVTFT